MGIMVLYHLWWVPGSVLESPFSTCMCAAFTMLGFQNIHLVSLP